jgi:hypothetical protein
MWNLIKWVAGMIGTLFVLAAQTPPEQATSNVAAWLKKLGMDNPPAIFESPSTDGWITAIGVILLATLLGWWLVGWKKKFFKMKKAAEPDQTSVAPSATLEMDGVKTTYLNTLASVPPNAKVKIIDKDGQHQHMQKYLEVRDPREPKKDEAKDKPEET